MSIPGWNGNSRQREERKEHVEDQATGDPDAYWRNPLQPCHFGERGIVVSDEVIRLPRTGTFHCMPPRGRAGLALRIGSMNTARCG